MTCRLGLLRFPPRFGRERHTLDTPNTLTPPWDPGGGGGGRLMSLGHFELGPDETLILTMLLPPTSQVKVESMREPMPVLREFLARPEVTEIFERRGRFGVMAYHGGNLERTTDAVAAEVARRTGSSFYGVIQDSPHRHHVASTHFDPDHSIALARFLDHVDIVITVHGYGRRRLRRHLLLGGRNRSLARHVAGHLRQGLPRRYRVLDDLEAIPKELRGQHSRNPVNRPTHAGVQIELPPTIRWNFREWGWSDHQGVSRTGDVARLIDALSGAVSSWPVESAGATPDARPSSAWRVDSVR